MVFKKNLGKRAYDIVKKFKGWGVGGGIVFY